MSTDIEEIRRLTHDYAWFVDTFKIDELMEQFTEDAVFDASPTGLTRIEGAPAIRSFFEEEFEMMTHQMHLISTHRIDVSGASASATVYYLAQGVTTDGGEVLARGYYDDTYAKADGRWRIKDRTAYALMPPQLEAQINAVAQSSGGSA